MLDWDGQAEGSERGGCEGWVKVKMDGGDMVLVER